MPSYDIINRWKRENPAFYQAYSRAREASAEACEHNALASAEMAVDNDTASAARVRVMAWQWTAAKRNPRVYADKIDATVTINVGLAERLSAAIGRASRVIDVDAEPSGDVGEIG